MHDWLKLLKTTDFTDLLLIRGGSVVAIVSGSEFLQGIDKTAIDILVRHDVILS